MVLTEVLPLDLGQISSSLLFLQSHPCIMEQEHYTWQVVCLEQEYYTWQLVCLEQEYYTWQVVCMEQEFIISDDLIINYFCSNYVLL